MTRYPEVALLVACRNEAPALSSLLPRVPHGIEVVLCDNGSTDGSRELAERWGAKVVSERRHRYVGAAIRRGLLATDAAIVIVIDGDGTVDPRDLEQLITPIRCGLAEMTVGVREFAERASALPRMMTTVRNCLFRMVTGSNIEDLGTARAFRRADLLPVAHRLNTRYGWNLSSTVAAIESFGTSRVHGVRIAHHPRIGRSQISGSLIGALIASWDSLKVLGTNSSWRARRAARSPSAQTQASYASR